jgi:anti-sigma regulatory factor (Ser/Thr protein kinase)
MNDLFDRPVRLVIHALAAHLPIVRAAAGKLCEELGFDSQQVGNIVLSVDEALANVIKHVYGKDSSRNIEIELLPRHCDGGRELCIRVRDWGRFTDPAAIRSRRLEDVRPGGLGVHIMHECMDSVVYTQAEGGGTLLTMIKRLPALGQESEQ